jgi:sec-independent protein translocase protein TatA
MPGPTELIIVLVVILFLFGAKKLPELAGSLGKSAKEFRKGAEDDEQEPSATEPSTD